MPDPTLPFPEFEISVDAMVAEAALDLVRADPALSNYFKTIDVYEIDEFLEADSFAPPALGLIPDASDERRIGGNRQAILTTAVAFVYVTAQPHRAGTQRFLRLRIFNYLKRLLAANAGELLWQGRRVSEALLTFRRLSGGRMHPSGSYFVTRAVAEFQSNVHEATREFIE